MKIDSATIGMESAGSYRASKTTVRRFLLMDYNSSNAANAGEEAAETKTENGKRNVTTMQEWQSRFQARASKVSIRSSTEQAFMELKQQTLWYIFELLFGNRRSAPAENRPALQQQEPMTANLKVLNYSGETYFEESETANFSTVGTVKTADGREINFNVNVGMSREFQEYYRDELNVNAFTMCDPLVINLETDVAQLEDQTFYFDIDADGEADKIAQMNSASGYLALDKNGDGQINDGSELFGTQSGDGFRDLAEYDEDGNGWIDENDAVWSRLKIWSKDAAGNDVLYRLADKGVGAICLQNAETNFSQRGSEGQMLGAVRKTGIFLYEDGNVGTVQHLDIAK